MLHRVVSRAVPRNAAWARSMSSSGPHGLQVFEYEELQGETTPDLERRIKQAFGYEGLGILAVRGVPTYLEKRETLLPMAYELANKPEEQLKEMEHPESYYNFGWSRGKEMLEGGKPDFAKGSFYANPIVDVPTDNQELIEKYPSFYMPNIWPTTLMPSLEGHFKSLGQLIVEVGIDVARHFDRVIATENPSYPADRIGNILRSSLACKARLLHYYPVEDPTALSDLSSWCGWHNDHGSLTGLCNAMYHEEDGTPIPCPDAEAGLYIKSRQGEVVRVVMPSDCMAFQIGECSQIQSGGVLQATPHAVRAAAAPHVSRSTLAVFMEPEALEPMTIPPGADADKVVRGARGELLPPSVPPLASRWNETQDFGTFSNDTFAAYHD